MTTTQLRTITVQLTDHEATLVGEALLNHAVWLRDEAHAMADDRAAVLAPVYYDEARTIDAVRRRIYKHQGTKEA